MLKPELLTNQDSALNDEHISIYENRHLPNCITHLIQHLLQTVLSIFRVDLETLSTLSVLVGLNLTSKSPALKE